MVSCVTAHTLRLNAVLLILVLFPGIASAQADPAEVTLGERLFLETRFAQFFKTFLDTGRGVNDRMTKGDPAMNRTVRALGAALSGPFTGESMNCRACHLVDEHLETPGGGMRSYSDFARRSPIPARPEDTKTTSPRNSPSLVNASLFREPGKQFHFDAEFATLEDLIASAFTSRNFGWLSGERAQAVRHLARVIREDNGQGPLAGDFGNLPYAVVLTGTGQMPEEFRLPASFRVNVYSASDEDIFRAMAKLVAAYTAQLEFSRDQRGNFNLSPYDRFLDVNKLPQSPLPGETQIAYSRRLLQQLNSLEAQGRLKYVTRNPNSQNEQFDFHDLPFRFDREEVLGMKIFLREPKAAVASPAELVAGGVSNCIACHAAPNFTDFRFHNTGSTQTEYDAIHGNGSFALLSIPDLAARNANHNAWLPATEQHPLAKEPFRSVPVLSDRSLTDLGVWNIFANPDFPKTQAMLTSILCQQFGTGPFSCTPELLLPKTIGIFKTPGLRDLGHSAPFMHTGAFNNLPQVAAFYRTNSDKSRAGTLRNGAPQLSGIALKPVDIEPLVLFLRALNEDYN